MLRIQASSLREDTGMNVSNSSLERWWKQEMTGNNICDCNDNEAYIELADGSQLWYSFQDAHTREKSMESAVKKLKIEDVQFDFIIFNLGNPPRYDLSRLRRDLESLKHSDKPVLYISQGKFQDSVNREATDAVGGMAGFR